MEPPFKQEIDNLLPLIQASLSTERRGNIGSILLHGTTGVGKTSLAAALGRHCKNFAEVRQLNCTALFGASVGVAESRLAAHFTELRKVAPALCIMEDIEVLALRGAAVKSITAARLLAVLCRLLDTCSCASIIVIASCRDPANLDPRVFAPGRLDFFFSMPPPDLAHRRTILGES